MAPLEADSNLNLLKRRVFVSEPYVSHGRLTLTVMRHMQIRSGFKSGHKYRLMTVVAVAVGAVLTASTAAQAAAPTDTAPSNSVTIERTAQAVAKGVVVKVMLDIVCPADVDVQAYANLAEATGKVITQAAAATIITCTGARQTLTMVIQATTAPFKKGKAWATASVFPENGTFQSVGDSRVIRIK